VPGKPMRRHRVCAHDDKLDLMFYEQAKHVAEVGVERLSSPSVSLRAHMCLRRHSQRSSNVSITLLYRQHRPPFIRRYCSGTRAAPCDPSASAGSLIQLSPHTPTMIITMNT